MYLFILICIPNIFQAIEPVMGHQTEKGDANQWFIPKAPSGLWSAGWIWEISPRRQQHSQFQTGGMYRDITVYIFQQEFIDYKVVINYVINIIWIFMYRLQMCQGFCFTWTQTNHRWILLITWKKADHFLPSLQTLDRRRKPLPTTWRIWRDFFGTSSPLQALFRQTEPCLSNASISSYAWMNCRSPWASRCLRKLLGKGIYFKLILTEMYFKISVYY